jgi:hypothetical protein
MLRKGIPFLVSQSDRVETDAEIFFGLAITVLPIFGQRIL